MMHADEPEPHTKTESWIMAVAVITLVTFLAVALMASDTSISFVL